jgi:hypothetical protein
MLTEASMSQRARPGAGKDELLEKVSVDSHIESYPTTTTTLNIASHVFAHISPYKIHMKADQPLKLLYKYKLYQERQS